MGSEWSQSSGTSGHSGLGNLRRAECSVVPLVIRCYLDWPMPSSSVAEQADTIRESPGALVSLDRRGLEAT